MKTIISFLMLLVLPFISISQQDCTVWENRVGFENGMNQYANAVVDSDGNIYHILHLNDSVKLEESNTSVYTDENKRGLFIRKIDDQGKVQWQKLYQNATTAAASITPNNQLAILVGNHLPEQKVQYEVVVFDQGNGDEVIKLGVLPVVDSYGIIAPDIRLVQFLQDGTFVIAGNAPKKSLEGKRSTDEEVHVHSHFVMKFDTGGNKLWIQSFEGDPGSRIQDVCVDTDDNIYAVGTANNTAVLEGKPLNVIGRSDGFLWGISSAGTTKFMQPIGGEYRDGITTVDTDRSGDLYVGGRFEYSIELPTANGQLMFANERRFNSFVAKFNSEGEAIWAHTFKGTSSSSHIAMVRCLNTGIAISGFFYGTEKYETAYMDVAPGDEVYKLEASSPTFFIAWLDENGVLQNATTAQKNFENDKVRATAISGSDSYIVTWIKYVQDADANYHKKIATQKYMSVPQRNVTTRASCGPFTWRVNGKVYNESGTYTADIGGETHHLNLEVLTLDTSVETVYGESKTELKAAPQDVFYQWLDCTNDCFSIYEEESSTFTTDENGKYAVIVKSPYCQVQDTSNVFELAFDRVSQKDLDRWYRIDYENPQLIEDIEKVHLPLDGNKVKMIPFRSSEKYGFVSKGNLDAVIVEPMFEEVFAVDENGAIVKYPEGGYGVINNIGESIVPLGYSQVLKEGSLYHGTLGSVIFRDPNLPEQYQSTNLHVFYDVSGKELFRQYAHEHENFEYENYAWFRYGKTYKVYDTLGTIVDSFPVNEKNDVEFIGIADNKILHLDYKENVLTARNIGGGTAFQIPGIIGNKVYQLNSTLYGVLTSDFNYYFLDAEGKPLPFASTSGYIGFHESDPRFFEQEYFIVRNSKLDKVGVIDRNGKATIPFEYDGIVLRSKNLWRCSKKGGDIVYRNEKGETKPFEKKYPKGMWIPREKGMILQGGFHDGLICTWAHENRIDTLANGKMDYVELSHYVYYDSLGNIALELDTNIYLVGDFSEGLAPALNRERGLGFINKKGEWAIAPAYELTMAGAYPMPYIVTPEFIGGFAYIKSHKGYITSSGRELFEGKRMQDHYGFSH